MRANPLLWVGMGPMSSSSKVTVPVLTSSRPAIARSNVDLPQPEGPTTASTRPAGTSKVAPSTARKSSKDTLTSRRLNISETPDVGGSQAFDEPDGGGGEHGQHHTRSQRHPKVVHPG